MALRLTVLGSGTIVPSQVRRATSLLIEGGGEEILVDCGPGALQALEEAGRSYRDIHRILLTHFHPDHTLGLGRLFSALKADVALPGSYWIVIYGPDGLERFITGWDGLYGGMVPDDDTLNLVTMEPGYEIDIGEMLVTAGPADHAGRPALAYRIEMEGRSIVYTGDTSRSGALARFATGADLLVAECSFPDEAPADGHMTPADVGSIADSAGAGEVLLVHMYPFFGETDPAAEVRRRFGGKVTTGRDGMVIEL
jgi:ribonuclease BN (tRNA processing enzyme)